MQVLKRELKFRDTTSWENHFFLRVDGVQVRIARTSNLIIVQMGDDISMAESSMHFMGVNYLHELIYLYKKVMRDLINNRKKQGEFKCGF